MRDNDRQRVLDLMGHLERLEADEPTPGEESVHQIAQRAIIDEISRLVRRDWLAVYRKGDSIDVISMT